MTDYTKCDVIDLIMTSLASHASKKCLKIKWLPLSVLKLLFGLQ